MKQIKQMLYHSTVRMLWLCPSHSFQFSKAVQASVSHSFITSPAIILMSTLSAQGFVGSFEHEKAFCYGEVRRRTKSGEGSRDKKPGERFYEGERNMLGKASLCQPAWTSLLLASVQVWACSFVHLNNCLPESEPEWHSCSKRTPTGSGICSRGGGKKLFAHCSQFLRRKKKNLRNLVPFHHWSRSRKKKSVGLCVYI